MSPDGLAINLRRVREARRLTQNALGQRAGVSRNYIASLEGGRITNPGVFPVYALARALGVTVEALLGRRTLVVESVRARVYTLADAQRELEARLALIGTDPFEPMTDAQTDAYVPAILTREELFAAATMAVEHHLARSLGVEPRWAALSWYSAGAVALAVREENTEGISRR